jgi:uncharacterized membrane protein
MLAHCRIPGDPARQLLVGVPLGLMVTSVIFDLVAVRNGMELWWTYSWVSLYAGITMAVIALPMTLVNNFDVQPENRLHRVRRLHEWLQAGAVLLFLGSWMLRDINGGAAGVSSSTLQLSLAGAAIAVLSALAGDELVFRMRSLRERRRATRRPTHYLHHPSR